MAAPVVVQSTTATTGDVSSAVATPALTGIALGSLLLLVVAGWESGNDGFPNSVTDSMGNGWNLVASSQGPANGFTLQTYWTRAKTGGSNTVSVAMASGATGNASCCLMEISGADASSPIDQVLLATATSTSPSVGPTGTTSQADELSISAFAAADTNSGWDNPPTSYTSQAQITAKCYLNVSTLGLSSTGTQTVSYGTLASSTQWAASIVTIKAYIAPVSDNLVAVTSTTTGTGTYTLGSAVSGFQGSGGLTNGAVYGYVADDGAGNWEVGTGTYTSAGTTLSRTLVASSTGSLISWAAGSRTIKISALAQELRPTLTVFTGNGTWTPLATSKFFIAQAYGAGGGGGAGSCWTSTQAAGAGGSGGGYAIVRGRIADISTPVTITVGTGGNGGTAANGAIGQDGGDGSGGGTSSFGTYAKGYGGGGSAGGLNSGSGGGSGGGAGYLGAGSNATTASAGGAGSGGGVAGVAGNTGGSAAPNGTISQTVFGGSAGGAGGGIAGAPNGNGGTGGASFGGGSGGGGGGARAGSDCVGGAGGATNALSGGTAGTTGGGNGGAGNSSIWSAGSGGGGGGGGTTASTGNGGAGGTPGGGGGGGGAISVSGLGSVGGAGGRGEVRVWEW